MRSANKWVILAGSFVVYLFDAMEIIILTFALPAIRADLGVTAVQAGMLATATLLGIGVSALFAGWFADTHGRKTALVLSLIVFGVFTAALYLAPDLGTLTVLRFLAGLGLGGVWGIISAFMVESWPAAQRGKAVAFVLAAFPIGGAVASLVSGLFLPNWRLMFLVTGIATVVPLVIVMAFFSESAEWVRTRQAMTEQKRTSEVSLARIFHRDYLRVTVIASLVTTAAFIAYYGASTWLPSYLATERGLDSRTVSLFMTVLNLGMFVGYLAFGWVADKIGKKNALLISFFGTGLLMPLYGLATNHTLLLWLGPLYAFFMTFAGLFGSYMGELYPTAIRTTGSGFCFNIGRGISAFAPMLLGSIAANHSLAAGLVVSGAIFLLAGVFMAFLPHTEGRREQLVDPVSRTELARA